jgi:hypothetical protein
MEALGSSETSVLTRTTLCNIPEDGILQAIDRFQNTNLEVTKAHKYEHLTLLYPDDEMKI